jgi:hypothetical protein
MELLLVLILRAEKDLSLEAELFLWLYGDPAGETTVKYRDEERAGALTLFFGLPLEVSLTSTLTLEVGIIVSLSSLV